MKAASGRAAVPRHPLADRLRRRRARPPLDRLPAGLQGKRSLLRLFVDKGGSIEIDEYHRQSPTRAAPKSRRTVITIPHPTNANHNGGQMQFLGEDLYFGTGDGGAGGDPPNNAQNKDVLLGKLLRIDPLPADGKPYSVPAVEPVRRRRRPARDLQLRPAQSVPLQLRLGHRPEGTADRDRRRRPEQVRGDRLRDASPPRRRQLRLGRDRGLAALRRRRLRDARPRRHHEADLRLPPLPRRQLLGDRRLRRRRPTLPSLYGRYVYADYCEGQLRALTPHLHRASGDHKLGLAVPSPPPSAKTTPTTSTSPPRTAPSTASSRSSHSSPSAARTRLVLADQPKGTEE